MRFHFLAVSAIIWVLFAETAFAQTFTGTLDGYWSYNTNTAAFQLNCFRAFDIDDQAFSMNYGEVAVSRTLPQHSFHGVILRCGPNTVATGPQKRFSTRRRAKTPASSITRTPLRLV
jgi:hypothetical protein